MKTTTLTTAGDGDGIVSASDMETLAQVLPRSTSATVPHAGHAPMLEADASFTCALYCEHSEHFQLFSFYFLLLFLFLKDLQV